MTQPSPAVILQLRSAASASRDSILREAGYRVIQTESREDLWRLLQEVRGVMIALRWTCSRCHAEWPTNPADNASPTSPVS